LLLFGVEPLVVPPLPAPVEIHDGIVFADNSTAAVAAR
jgi:hypothetical protein